MKVWIPMIVLLLSIFALCFWDTYHTTSVLGYLKGKSNYIYETLQTTEITDANLQTQIFNLNEYWTKKMDTLSVSISRKDLQPVSDYLQYLCASILNLNQEDAITYSRLLNYNIVGITETNGVSWINLL